MSDLDTTSPILPAASCELMVKIVMFCTWRNDGNG